MAQRAYGSNPHRTQSNPGTMSTRTNIGESADALRIPPHSIEAEQSVLGGLLLDNQAWDAVGFHVSKADFYRWEHQEVFDAIGALIMACKPADVITVHELLREKGHAEHCGGLSYLNSLAQSVPSSANAQRYAEIVREKAIFRQLMAAGEDIITNALQPGGRSAVQLLDEMESKVLNIANQGLSWERNWHGMDELIVGALDHIQDVADAGGKIVTGVATGFVDLDRMTTGLQGGELVVLAARPSMGKTAFALNIAENVAARNGLPAFVFSMEMGASQLALRLLGSFARIDQTRMKTGQLTDDEWSRLSEAVELLKDAPIHIDESGAMSIMELRARARRKARECGGQVGVIVVDYLQLMSGGDGDGAPQENRATSLGEVSRGLKTLAKELNCPVIALSQLNRAVESRPDKRPMMSDLRESGAIEQDADMVVFIYRDEYYNKESTEQGIAEIIVGKARNGPVGTVKLAFLKACTKFMDLAP